MPNPLARVLAPLLLFLPSTSWKKARSRLNRPQRRRQRRAVAPPRAAACPALGSLRRLSHRSRQKTSDMTVEQAVQDYLEDQRNHHRCPKTLQWHQQALVLFQHSLLTEHQCLLLGQITEAQVCGWLAFLPQMPTATGALRSPSTVESYARSTRAFCQWLVRHQYLQATPFAHLLLPQVENRLLRPLEPEEWEHLLACHPQRKRMCWQSGRQHATVPSSG